MGEDIRIAEQAVLLFFKNMVWHLGILVPVVHDRDPRFTSDFWQSLWKLLGSYAIATFAYNLQANGQTECINSTIGQFFCFDLINEDQENLSDYVAIIEIAINSTINASIQKTPFEILYCKNITVPVGLLLSRESSINLQAYKLASKIKQFVANVRSAMYIAQ